MNFLSTKHYQQFWVHYIPQNWVFLSRDFPHCSPRAITNSSNSLLFQMNKMNIAC
jgi:hypothetical protein